MPRSFVRLATVIFLVSLSASAAGSGIDWNAVDSQDVVEILTTDSDGERRETPVWLAVVGERGYVCTNETRWYVNLQRDPQLELRAGDAVHALRAERIDDPVLRERVDAAFRAKYPWGRWVMELFGGTGGANCLALSSR